jgi:hypothetical protein
MAKRQQRRQSTAKAVNSEGSQQRRQSTAKTGGQSKATGRMEMVPLTPEQD